MKHPVLDPLAVSPENIWRYEHNRPTLVAEDLERFGVPRSVTYAVLAARGVFKWLAVRRDLIRYKDHLRGEVTRVLAAIRNAKASGNLALVHELRGRLRAYEEVFAAVRALCHSDRWRAPDFDGDAWRWLLARAPFSPDGRWVRLARQIRHARLGSDDVDDAALLAEVAAC